MRLLALGINPTEEEVYTYLLSRKWRGIIQATSDIGLDGEELSVSLKKLDALGMIRTSEDGNVSPIDPTAAIEMLIEARNSELNAELRKVSSTRAEIPYFKSRKNHQDSEIGTIGIERLENLKDVRERLDELSFFSYQEIIAIHPGAGFRLDTIEAARPLDMRCLRRGTRMLTIVHETALDNVPTVTYLREVASLGAQVRVSSEKLERLLIYDQKVAVVPIDPSNTSSGALIIREQGLLAQISDLFNRIWETSEDLLQGRRGTDASVITPLEREVISTLATADKDEVGAREMGVAVRTYRGYVANLMTKLNASSRFQIALIAKERGWI